MQVAHRGRAPPHMQKAELEGGFLVFSPAQHQPLNGFFTFPLAPFLLPV